MTVMLDVKRVRTFLSYKGFKWEPILTNGDVAGPAGDFHACQDGQIRFCTSVISIGNDHPSDGLPIKSVIDDQEKKNLCNQLTRQLNDCVQRWVDIDSSLPIVTVFVNHEPCCDFEDLYAIVDSLESENLSKIHLFIWFDDFQDDKMLFSQLDPGLCRGMYEWFHSE